MIWYQTQERAMAPGIADGWPEVIPAPHTVNGRLVRREGPSPDEQAARIRELEAERNAAFARGFRWAIERVRQAMTDEWVETALDPQSAYDRALAAFEAEQRDETSAPADRVSVAARGLGAKEKAPRLDLTSGLGAQGVGAGGLKMSGDSVPQSQRDDEWDRAIRRWWICCDEMSHKALGSMTATQVAIGIRSILDNPDDGVVVQEGRCHSAAITRHDAADVLDRLGKSPGRSHQPDAEGRQVTRHNRDTNNQETHDEPA